MPPTRCSPPTARSVAIIHDSPGFIVQRVLAHIVNVACDIAQQRIAAPADIDLAVRIGLGYPMGPLAWGDALGPARAARHPERARARLRRPALSAEPVAVAPRPPRGVAADARGVSAPALQRRGLQPPMRGSMMIVSSHQSEIDR